MIFLIVLLINVEAASQLQGDRHFTKSEIGLKENHVQSLEQRQVHIREISKSVVQVQMLALLTIEAAAERLDDIALFLGAEMSEVQKALGDSHARWVTQKEIVQAKWQLMMP